MATEERPVIVVAHRGPGLVLDRGWSARHRPGRRWARHRATRPSQPPQDGVWVCAALSAEDEAIAAENDGSAFAARRGLPRPDGPASTLTSTSGSTPSSPTRCCGSSSTTCGTLATPPISPANETEAFENGYVPVNRAIADAVADEVDARRRPGHRDDPRLPLLSGAASGAARCPDAILHHFIHIPWPQPDAWRVLPAPIREQLLHGLLACDIVAFHTEQFARNFVLTCQELLDLPVDMRQPHHRRSVAARSPPAGTRSRSMPTTSRCKPRDPEVDRP